MGNRYWKHAGQLESWSQNRCIKCQRFLGRYGNKYCSKCYNQSQLERPYNPEAMRKYHQSLKGKEALKREQRKYWIKHKEFAKKSQQRYRESIRGKETKREANRKYREKQKLANSIFEN